MIHNIQMSFVLHPDILPNMITTQPSNSQIVNNIVHFKAAKLKDGATGQLNIMISKRESSALVETRIICSEEGLH